VKKWPPELREGEKEYLNGLLSGLDDYPDGAWSEICKDRIRKDPKFKGRDPYEVWIAWVAATAIKTVRNKDIDKGG
jgi:hypothetical protein